MLEKFKSLEKVAISTKHFPIVLRNELRNFIPNFTVIVTLQDILVIACEEGLECLKKRLDEGTLNEVTDCGGQEVAKEEEAAPGASLTGSEGFEVMEMGTKFAYKEISEEEAIKLGYDVEAVRNEFQADADEFNRTGKPKFIVPAGIKEEG